MQKLMRTTRPLRSRAACSYAVGVLLFAATAIALSAPVLGTSQSSHAATGALSASIADPAAFHDATPPGMLGLTDTSIAWGDYDNDGLLDLLLIGQAASAVTRLYHNDGGGAFHDATPPGVPAAYRGTVAWGDYDNDGLLDFFIHAYSPGTGYMSKLYHNDGGGAFHDATPPGPAGGMDGTVTWADYDNDGLRDFLVGGFNGGAGGKSTRLYHNDGGGAFHDATPAVLPRLAGASIAWGDYDNEGYLDLLITGEGGTTGILSKLYHNDGAGAFHDTTPPGLPGLDYGTVAWGDYDNDGLLDFLLKGSGAPGYVSRIYHNDGGGAFHDVTQAGLLGLTLGDAEWGDYNNDGLLDLAITGSRNTGYFSKLYRNSGGGQFVDVTPLDWPGTQLGSVSWADFDNDGRLDLLLTGTTAGFTYITRLYHNDAPLANTPPSAPGDLTVSGVTTSSVVLGWSAAADTETAAAGLSYNLRVGTSPGAADVVGPMANTGVPTQPNGLRRIPALGPARPSLSTSLRSLAPGTTYYWSVQAIDSAWAGGPFAVEGQFTTDAPPTPTPTVANFVGHVTWQSIPQNNTRSILPITLTLKLGSGEANYPQQNTDASGFFTVSVGNLAPGTYSWRAMGPDGVSGANGSPGFLANCGQIVLTGAQRTDAELGTMSGGDADNNNIINALDFNIVKLDFGISDRWRADFNNDGVVNSSDFNILKVNFGHAGCGAALRSWRP
jgi:hypothetical protein